MNIRSSQDCPRPGCKTDTAKWRSALKWGLRFRRRQWRAKPRLKCGSSAASLSCANRLPERIVPRRRSDSISFQELKYHVQSSASLANQRSCLELGAIVGVGTGKPHGDDFSCE